MGPWGHQVKSDRKLGEVDFGHEAVVDLYTIMNGFLDEAVRGRVSAEPVAPADEWLHDPDRPVPFITVASAAQIGGPDDFAGVETRENLDAMVSRLAD